MAAVTPQLEAAGASVVGIGQGARFQAKALEERGLGFELFLDRERALYEALGMQRWSWLHFLTDVRGFGRWTRAFLRHRRQGLPTASPTSSCGAALLDTDGTALFVHQGRGLGDYPPVSELVQLVERAGLGG